MKNILITGSGGLIGSHLIKKLSMQRDYRIFALTSSDQNSSLNNVIYIPIDFSKDWNIDQLPVTIESIVHLAQSPHFRDFPERSEQIFSTNVNSTVKLLDFAYQNNVRSFTYASSGGIYGNKEYGFDESEIIEATGDLGFYLATKLCSEIITQTYSSFFYTKILRFFFVYGPGQKKGMLIPRLVENVRNGHEISIQGKEGIKLNPVYVDDAVDSIIASDRLEHNSKINVGGPDEVSILQISEMIGEIVGTSPNLSFKDQVPKNLLADVTKMRSLLGRELIQFRKGLKSYIGSTYPEYANIT